MDWRGGADSEELARWDQCPSGQHLVDLMRHSDDVLQVLLILAGRQQTVAVQRLVDLRSKLAEMVEHIDISMGEDTTAR
jgi:hypothetical protein